jgi:hypothetical protein
MSLEQRGGEEGKPRGCMGVADAHAAKDRRAPERGSSNNLGRFSVVIVNEVAQDLAAGDFAFFRIAARPFRRLQFERATRSSLVVVGNELLRHPPEMLFIEDNEATQAFLTAGRTRPRRMA